MATMDVTSWGLSVTPEQRLGAKSRRWSPWRALSRFLYSAATASAMSDPQVYAMLYADRLERARDGR